MLKENRKNIKKLNASIRLIQKFNTLAKIISNFSEATFKQPKINNTMITKVFNLLKSEDARYLNQHCTFAYNQFDIVDTDYLDVDYIHNDFNTCYAYNNHLELTYNIGRYAMKFSHLAKQQYHHLKSTEYKYLHYTYHSNTKPDSDGVGVDILSDTYTGFSIPSKAIILNIIEEIKTDASIPHIINTDYKALKQNVKTDLLSYQMDLKDPKLHKFLQRDRKNIKNSKKRLNNFDTSDPF